MVPTLWLCLSLASAAVYAPDPCPNAALHSVHSVDTQFIELESFGVRGEVYIVFDDNAVDVEIHLAGKGYEFNVTTIEEDNATRFSFSAFSTPPTNSPSMTPTTTPTNHPTNVPTNDPTNTPTNAPTNHLTNAPTASVPTTLAPQNAPTDAIIRQINAGRGLAPSSYSFAVICSILFVASSRYHYLAGICVLLLAAPVFGVLQCDVDNTVAITVIVPRNFPSRNIVIKTADTLAFGVLDPSPQASLPGDTTCPGCPNSTDTIPSFEVNASTSTQVFTGQVQGVEGQGYWYVTGDNVISGRRLLQTDSLSFGGTIPVSPSGSYTVEIPLLCGRQVVKLVFTNSQGVFSRLYVVSAIITCSAFHAALTWDQVGNDWDLHFMAPGQCYTSNGDCYYNNKAPPHATLDIDCISSCSTENIVMSKENSLPGTFYLLLHNYRGVDDVTGRITITSSLGTIPQQRTIHVDGLVNNGKLLIAAVDGVTGKITPLNVPFDGTCPDISTEAIVLADRAVSGTLGLYHYSLKYFTNILAPLPLVGNAAGDAQPCSDIAQWGTQTGSMELLRDSDGDYYSWQWKGSCWEWTSIAISRINFADTGVNCLPLKTSWSSLSTQWSSIVDAATIYRAAEQPGVIPPNLTHWPSSRYLISYEAVNSNTFAREMVQGAGLRMVELGGLHPGLDAGLQESTDPALYSDQPGPVSPRLPIPTTQVNQDECLFG